MKFSLCSENKEYTNEQLRKECFNRVPPPIMYEKMFYYGRYLFISSSGRRPPNLQGLWNDRYFASWCGAYTLDENIQMHHWQAMPGNLLELMEPYWKFVEEAVPQWKENAAAFYGCAGVLAPIAAADHQALSDNMPYLMVTCIAGWLIRQFYTGYLYTDDLSFLKNRAVPLLEEAAAFYADFMYENAAGQLTVCPSMSPENYPLVEEKNFSCSTSLRSSVNPTVDIAVAKDIFTCLLQAYRVLGIGVEKAKKWETMLQKLPAYALNEDGAVKEWIHPLYKDNYRHRHLSHLYPFFPGTEIPPEDSPLFCACKKTLDKKMEVGFKSMTAWSFAHMAQAYARGKEPEKSVECLNLIMKCCLAENFYTVIWDNRGMGVAENLSLPDAAPYPEQIFQLDANTGITSSIMEMLVYSRDEDIYIFNGLPKSWKTGSLRNVKCMHNTTLSLQWDTTQKQYAVTVTGRKPTCKTLHFPSYVHRVTVNGVPCKVCGGSLAVMPHAE